MKQSGDSVFILSSLPTLGLLQARVSQVSQSSVSSAALEPWNGILITKLLAFLILRFMSAVDRLRILAERKTSTSLAA